MFVCRECRKVPFARMKKSTAWLVMGAAAVIAAISGAPAEAADVGVSIEVSQPGVYGRIDIGRYPQPAVMVSRPVLVRPAPVYGAPPEPVYLWVPPGHRRHWARYCGRYNACAAPVYFVREDWYRRHVAPPPPPRADERRGPPQGEWRGGPPRGEGHGRHGGHGGRGRSED